MYNWYNKKKRKEKKKTKWEYIVHWVDDKKRNMPKQEMKSKANCETTGAYIPTQKSQVK